MPASKTTVSRSIDQSRDIVRTATCDCSCETCVSIMESLGLANFIRSHLDLGLNVLRFNPHSLRSSLAGYCNSNCRTSNMSDTDWTSHVQSCITANLNARERLAGKIIRTDPATQNQSQNLFHALCVVYDCLNIIRNMLKTVDKGVDLTGWVGVKSRRDLGHHQVMYDVSAFMVERITPFDFS